MSRNSKGTTGTEAEARRIKKYSELIDNEYTFQPVGMKEQFSLSDSKETFVTSLCKKLSFP